ncbi:hypothetical protein CONPUDRAFT_145914 [Coniophora puteana RWD-64-598 SS2]|uniref:Uncharacterized protein n=1 Tax=Coniophora puteana (strain RWD-64-598) TaxID=741705 RepID=A0A5M3MEL0_CONPW|nr:uncharacterized protein CONPUDRAFT_145914 [Coniophora puteana RWD-64-598 SS2]EIW77658.1 hypothetical protein CONPUDRAFT_145914 [Coniophora puteana RWD-64-598 SS2]
MNSAQLAHLRQCNALSKLGSLPQETLVNILTFSSRCGAQDLDIVRWTHVCSFIREVALRHPQLWCYLPFRVTSELRVLAMILFRSQNVPRDIEMKLESPLSMDGTHLAILTELLRDVGKLRSLHLVASPTLVSRCLKENHALQLRSLCISFLRDNDGTEAQDLPINGELFGGQTPVLRELTLDKGALLWNSSIFAGLTSLRITNVCDQEMPTPDQLLDTLRSATKLEKLQLSGRLAGVPFEPSMVAPPDDRLVTLSSLQKLELRQMDFKTYGFIIGHLDFPFSTRVSVLEISGSWRARYGLTKSPILPSKLFTEPIHPSTPSRTLVLKKNTSAFGITSYRCALEGPEWYNFRPSAHHPHVEASFSCTGMDTFDHAPLVYNIPMSDVHTLKIIGTFPQEYVFWRNVFTHAPHVRRLFVGADLGPTGSLSFLLWALMPSCLSGNAEPPLLPHLAELHISLYDRGHMKGVSSDIFRTVLNARASAGSEITSFTMKLSRHISLFFLTTFAGATMVVDKKDLVIPGYEDVDEETNWTGSDASESGDGEAGRGPGSQS